ncbi:hypothetical protein [Bradyrhizobium sp. 33ap4]|uniref:hypothetical protein n=1 Tax=Bradyrhizobium sp. 33ap4 TaxID=3061630 RepID=UPI002930EE7A|nr:hypothetical protein [Bradyrhizobium sp. 33ap4]
MSAATPRQHARVHIRQWHFMAVAHLASSADTSDGPDVLSEGRAGAVFASIFGLAEPMRLLGRSDVRNEITAAS